MRLLITLSMLVTGLLIAAPAKAAINVFACEPEWGALAKEIDGEHVDVSVATSAKQNVHFLRAKPSLLASMRKADLVFCTGASLEAGWLPILLQKAGGPHVQPGQPGHLLAAKQVTLLDVPVVLDRSMGDVHPEGNPHISTDPHNILTVAKVLTDRLAAIDPARAVTYQANYQIFEQHWQGLLRKWEQQASSLKRMKVVVYHTSWTYLLDWLGIEAVAHLEPKPGIPPTTSHLEHVLQTVKGQEVDAILIAPFEDEKAAKWLSERAGVPVLVLPYTVGGSDSAGNLVTLFEETLRLLQEIS